MISIEQLDAARKLSVCADNLAYIQKNIPEKFKQKLQRLIHDMNVLSNEMCSEPSSIEFQRF